MLPKAAFIILHRALVRRAVSSAAMLLLCAAAAAAQTSSTDSSTPLALSQGAPAGSFPLSGFENINAYNGNLDFHLPMLHVGGRGGAQTTLTLALNTKHWHVLHQLRGPNQIDTFVPAPDQWFPLDPGYGPGILTGRRNGFSPLGPKPLCSGDRLPQFAYTVTTLTLKLPDGSEYQLRDTASDGQPQQSHCGQPAFNRGTTFVSTDGSAMTFVSDFSISDDNYHAGFVSPPSGFLMLRDGTQYRIDLGYIQWMRDRNGNSLTFAYDGGTTGLVTGITSSLGETVTVAYGIQDQTLGKLDLITYKGFGGTQRSIKVLRGTNLDGALRDTAMMVQTPAQLFPEAAMNGADSQNNYDPKVITKVIIPDGRFYQFLYNPYGEIARVIVPTGGTIDYEMAPGSGTITDVPNCGPGDCGSVGIYRTLQKRTVYPNGFPTIEGVTTYSQSINQAISTTTTIDHLGANGITLLSRDIHYFTGDPTTDLLAMSSSAQSTDVGSPNFYPTWNEGKEYQTDLVDPALGTLKSITNTFQNRQHVAWFPWGYGTEGEPAEDPRLTDTTTTLPDTNEVAFVSYLYDSFNNLTDTFQYDFGPQAHGGLIRHTQTQYVSDLNYTKPDKAHLRNLPSIVKVFGSGSSPLAETDYEYDNYTPEMTGTVNHAHLVDRPGMVGTDATLPHASDFTPIRSSTAYITRGNVTAVTTQVFQDSKTRISYTQFDIAGNPIAGIDPKGNKTTIDFSDRFGSPGGDPTTNTAPPELPAGSFAFAFPTKVTNPALFISYTQYDYYIGRPVNSQDWNGNNSSASYSDLLDRQTNVTRASLSSTAITYLDSSHTIKVASDRDSLSDGKLVTNTIYDGLGRTTETRLFETTTAYISTTRTYDAMGRTATVSNPHRTSAETAPTTTAYDGLSRPITVTTFDGAVVTSSYSGSTTTVTDQAGAVRDSQVDAAGRLKTVTEHPGGMTTYLTAYGYDALDDLTSVTQGTQARTFGYNSVKELTSSTNPENGTTGFTYDDNGNLFTRTDALTRTTTYTYDSLNRISTRTYSDSTPGVSYFYDDAMVSNSKGRLTKVTSSVSTYKYETYDALGRVTKSTQSTGLDYTMFYAYNAAGQMTSETYPSGKVIDMTYDGADRLASVAKHGGTSYASGITYASHGAVLSMTLGNGLIEATEYNNRLQPTSIKLGVSTADPQSMLGLSFAYSTTGHNDNNGNVLAQTITANSGTVQIGLQTYSYDGANRLIGATETGAWTQTYDYDQYGNRAVRMGSYLPNSQLTPQSANATDFSAFGGSQTKNRITVAGFVYNAAGNLTGDPTSATMVYDAENHQTSYTKSGTTNYAYDGDGHRVTKATGGTTTVFVYNAFGQLIAEYGGAATNGGISYLTTDHLGNTRAVTNSLNSQPDLVARHDYLPFGEEIPSGVGNRTPGLGYLTSDDTTQRFTGKERDTESGLYYFLARYCSAAEGRFTTADQSSFGEHNSAVPFGDPANPQSLNGYQYAYGNPLRYIDRDGHDILVIENGPTEGNPVGHTAIAVTGYGVFSFGNGTKLGSSTKDYIGREAPKRDTKLIIIKTTPEQDKAAVDALLKQDEKGGIGVISDNCSSRANSALDAIGVPVGGPVLDQGGGGGFSAVDKNMPGSAGERALTLGGASPDDVTTLTIPKGSTAIPEQLNQFEPKTPNPAPGLPRDENRTKGSSSSSSEEDEDL